MIAEGKIGPQYGAAGSLGTATFDNSWALRTAQAHGRYQEAVYRGNCYTAANQAAGALSLLSSTATGFILTNPLASGKGLAVLDICVALATAPAGAATICLSLGPYSATAVTQTTALVVRNLLMTGATGSAVGLAASAATLPATPVVIRALGGGPVAASSISPAFIRDEIAGQIILLPGCSLNVHSLTTAISAVISIAWEEIPIL